YACSSPSHFESFANPAVNEGASRCAVAVVRSSALLGTSKFPQSYKEDALARADNGNEIETPLITTAIKGIYRDEPSLISTGMINVQLQRYLPPSRPALHGSDNIPHHVCYRPKGRNLLRKRQRLLVLILILIPSFSIRIAVLLNPLVKQPSVLLILRP